MIGVIQLFRSFIVTNSAEANVCVIIRSRNEKIEFFDFLSSK